MIFVYINFAIMILDFVLLFLVAAKAEHMFKERYPGLEIPKSHWADSAVTWIKTTLAFICPLFNIACLWVYITREEELCENVIYKCYMKCMREANQNEPTDSTSCDIPSP